MSNDLKLPFVSLDHLNHEIKKEGKRNEGLIFPIVHLANFAGVRNQSLDFTPNLPSLTRAHDI
ncbi:11001_t:CDS:2, partial [Acaulospora morrowiae]